MDMLTIGPLRYINIVWQIRKARFVDTAITNLYFFETPLAGDY